jgi:hypothetical protein
MAKKQKPVLEKAPTAISLTRNQDTHVIVSFPGEIRNDLVQANELRHYEIFQWLLALIAPIASGFWIALINSDRDRGLLFSSIVFTLISLLFLGLAIYYRMKVYHSSIHRKINLGQLK